MATAADIQRVIDNLEAGYETHGWSETTIAGRLDTGQSVSRIISVYWTQRANSVIELVNTSESGSSRGNDAIYARMKALAAEWAKKADDEEDAAEVATEGHARNGQIVRI